MLILGAVPSAESKPKEGATFGLFDFYVNRVLGERWHELVKIRVIDFSRWKRGREGC